ncbi:putative signal peptide protein [Halorubrum sp. AJ67]|nr:putative signal peptide protein [Halorubrum sp. AJ67]
MLFIFLLLLGIVTTVGLVTAADSGYDIETESTIAVPEESETISQGGFSVTVESAKIAVIGPDEDLVVETTSPRENSYNVIFLNAQQDEIGNNDSVQGDAEVEFSAASEPPGSYAVIINDQSIVDAFLPVVIEAHQVDSFTLNGDPADGSDIAADEEVDVRVELTELSDTSISGVELVLWTDDSDEVHELERVDDHTYETSIDPPEEGEYRAHVRVRGEESAEGEKELIGLSENRDVTVSASDGGTGGTGNTGGSTGGEDGTDGGSAPDTGTDTTDSANGTDTTNGTDSANGTDTMNGTDSANGTDTMNGTDSANGTDTTNGTDTASGATDDSADDSSGDGTDSDGSTTDTSDSTDSTNDDDGPIEPNNETDSSDETADSTPLYAIQGVLLALIAGGTLRRLRRGR